MYLTLLLAIVILGDPNSLCLAQSDSTEFDLFSINDGPYIVQQSSSANIAGKIMVFGAGCVMSLNTIPTLLPSLIIFRKAGEEIGSRNDSLNATTGLDRPFTNVGDIT